VHQRDDDRPAAVEKRIQVYARETEPLVDYYRRAGTLTEVDGDRSIEEVGVALEDAVG
jgi:adenylate kinase